MIQNSNAETVQLGVMDERADVVVLAAVSMARTHQKSSIDVCTSQPQNIVYKQSTLQQNAG